MKCVSIVILIALLLAVPVALADEQATDAPILVPLGNVDRYLLISPPEADETG